MNDEAVPSHQDFLERDGTLLVLRPVAGANTADLFLGIADDGRVTGFCGHVDLGTGIATALAQIVAEELDVPVGAVTMVLGHTSVAPDQGATIASETIQVAAIPLRRAAAQARQFLLALAAETLAADMAELHIEAGRISAGGDRSIGLGALLRGRRDRLVLSDAASVKNVAEYRIVGQAVQRVDIPAKATGEFTYVHDVRVPGMLHGRVIRPPYAGLDSGAFVGTSLLSVDHASIADVPGLLALVVIRDFVGVVAEREDQAVLAAERLRLRWKRAPRLADLENPAEALQAQPSRPRTLLDTGGVEAALAGAATRLTRRYVWPYQMHASIGPSCAVADYRAEGLTVWSGTQNPHLLRADLAKLLDLSETFIDVIRLEAAGCYGRNCADDVAADAALLSRHVGRPVRVQLSREQEHLWEPKGAAQVMDVDGGLTVENAVAAYDFSTRYPSNAAPTLALLLTGAIDPDGDVSRMGDRTAVPPYRFARMRIVVHDMKPIVRASWLRGVSALPNSFAHDCYIDELAAAARTDPVEFRLKYLEDARARDLVRSVSQRAGWEQREGARCQAIGPDVRRGQGFAYARYVHGPFPGTAAAWSAWVAEVEVNTSTGDVAVTRVVVGQDNGLSINPAGLQHQIHGNVIQSVSRTLKEQVRFDATGVASREWGAYPILTFPDVPVIELVVMPRPEEPPLGAGESASVPSAAAIANAIFDATGVRLREPPFTPARVRAALQAADEAVAVQPAGRLRRFLKPFVWRRNLCQQAQFQAPPGRGQVKRPARAGALAALLGGIIGVATSLVAWPKSIPQAEPPDAGLYSQAAVARGKILAEIGNCAVCHTREGGVPNAGGRALQTPFGLIYASNITPDPATGIGAWPFAAFARAMRAGVHRDGRHLYPAFPYTSYARLTDNDLQALYAYLMSQPAVLSATPPTRLAFPFNMRPLMAAWNALFHRAGVYRPDPAHDAVWNRGAYLVEALGHCNACHAPRNLLGAESKVAKPFEGGRADGWEAPPLMAASHAPVPWTEADLFDYLRTGFSPLHGVAAGPMAPVVAGLARVPEAEVRAMAHYLASFQPRITQEQAEALAAGLEARASSAMPELDAQGASIYEGACAACHDASASPGFGVRPALALNTNLHAARPDNVLRVLLDGASPPGEAAHGAMPAFRNSFDDRQLASLLGYLRARFAADQPAWSGLEKAAARLRAESAPS